MGGLHPSINKFCNLQWFKAQSYGQTELSQCDNLGHANDCHYNREQSENGKDTNEGKSDSIVVPRSELLASQSGLIDGIARLEEQLLALRSHHYLAN